VACLERCAPCDHSPPLCWRFTTAGGVDPALCAPFTRGAGSQPKPPQNFLQNLANITTSGEDFKGTWLSAPLSFGHLSVASM